MPKLNGKGFLRAKCKRRKLFSGCLVDIMCSDSTGHINRVPWDEFDLWSQGQWSRVYNQHLTGIKRAQFCTCIQVATCIVSLFFTRVLKFLTLLRLWERKLWNH